MIGLPRKGRIFLRGIRLLPPRAGMIANLAIHKGFYFVDYEILLLVGQRRVHR